MQGEGPPVDAYVFMHLLEPGTDIPGVVESFGSKEGVRWAQQFVGSYVIFGAVTVSSLERLQELIAGEYWQAGARSEWSIVDKPSVFLAPHRHSPPYYALVRVRTRGNPRDVLDALDEAFTQKIDPLKDAHGDPEWREVFDYRAATVSGKGFDILVELADQSLEQLNDSIIEIIGTTSGVASTDSSFAYAPHPPHSEG
jgi:DNA-binding Lrp family transcriptional regulator